MITTVSTSEPSVRTVTIPLERYEKLVSIEAEFNVLARAYHTMPSYRLDDAMDVIFGSVVEKYVEKPRAEKTQEDNPC